MGKTLNIYTDGGSRGNPGPSAIGIYICSEDGTKIAALKKRLGVTTNNIAEYQAVLHAFDFLDKQPTTASFMVFYLDSLLVASQLSGLYKIKNPKLKEIRGQIAKYENKFRDQNINIKYQHILRKFNKKADALVNEALDYK